MELALNLAWAFSAIVIVCLWLRFAALAGTSRRTQWIALAVLILILFPVISVTDDLQAVQNPAEVDSCIRRVHAISHPHSTFPAVAAMPLPILAALPFGFLQMAAPGRSPAPVVDHPGLRTIHNRPPPVA
jgi:hypothetical protein